jgi:tetratricopeptide (TPR) repeat protein
MIITRRRWIEGACCAGVLVIAACGGVDSPDHVRQLHAEGRFEDSIEPLRDLLAEQPEDAELHYLHGVALIGAGEPRSAIWSLRKASEAPEWLVRASIELASIELDAQNWPRVIEAADRVLAAEPDHRRALFLRGEAHLGGKDGALQALADFEHLLELRPDHYSAQLRRAAALLMLDRIDEATLAMETLEASVEEEAVDDQFRAHLCTTRAVFDAEKGEVDVAEASFEECLERFPLNAIVLGQAMSFFDGRGEPEHANAMLQGVLEKAPHLLGYRAQLAARLRNAHDEEAAESLLRAGLGVGNAQHEAGIWTELTNHYLVLNDLPAAVEAYEGALALSPQPSTFAILTHADLLARAGQHERALEVASQLEDDAYRGLVEARIHLNEGRPAQALARFDAIFPSWPDNAGARYYAARAAEQLGDFERAVEEYRQSLRSGAEHSEAGLRLAMLLWAAGAPQLAWTGINHHVQAHPQDADAVPVLLGLAAEGGVTQLQAMLRQLRGTPHWPRALAIRIDTIAKQQGLDAALQAIRSQQSLDLTEARALPVLRASVVHLAAAGELAEAREHLKAALAANPDSADLHEIDGLLLEAEGASTETVQAAYLLALSHEPDHAQALTALGGIEERAGHVEAALDYYDRATRARFQDPDPARRAALLAARTGLLRDAEQRWEALLREHPWDAGGARALARLRLNRGDTSDRSLELARRAVMFQGGPEARDLLVEMHRARGEPERAAQVLEQLEAITSETAVVVGEIPHTGTQQAAEPGPAGEQP